MSRLVPDFKALLQQVLQEKIGGVVDRGYCVSVVLLSKGQITNSGTIFEANPLSSQFVAELRLFLIMRAILVGFLLSLMSCTSISLQYINVMVR